MGNEKETDAGLPETEAVPLFDEGETAGADASEEQPPTPEQIAAFRAKAAEYDDLYEKFQRAAAEFQNTQKRLERQARERAAFAIEEFARELLGVSDDLARAIHASEEHQTVEAILDGMQLVRKDLYTVLERHKITPIEVEAGAPFDPEFHEAISVAETTDYEPNRIVQEIQKGFLIHNRLLRPTRVIVSAAPAENDKG